MILEHILEILQTIMSSVIGLALSCINYSLILFSEPLKDHQTFVINISKY